VGAWRAKSLIRSVLGDLRKARKAEQVDKTFRLAGAEIRPIAEGYGACFATDRITVDGRQVGYMYREEPDNSLDSGWRFSAGDESDEHMDDPNNSGVYDVNTIANYDREIVSLLDSPIGSHFVRWPPESALGPEPT
jgi:hypothetical protein